MKLNDIEMNRLQVGAIQTNCYVVNKAEGLECCLIDPGEDATAIIHWLEDKKLSVVGILLTHGHFDHILAAAEVKNHFHTKIYVYEEEAELLGNADLNCSPMAGEPYELIADVLLKEGQILTLAELEIKVIHTPGHTKGSCCFLLEKDQVLFSGDTLFQESVGRTDLPTGNGNTLLKSIADKLMVLDQEVQVFPGHGEATSVDYERKNNPYI